MGQDHEAKGRGECLATILPLKKTWEEQYIPEKTSRKGEGLDKSLRARESPTSRKDEQTQD